MFKNILKIGVVLAILGIGFGYYMWNKAPQETNTIKADITISPAQLLAEYNADENVANTKYLDKIVEVSGTVKSINSTAMGSSLSLDTGDAMAAIICEFENKDAITSVKVGDIHTIKGFCSGKLMDIVLVRCSLK